jgi:hypothetical protein
MLWVVTVEELERWLAEDSPQRSKLERIRAQRAAIRALPDDDHARALRAIKKRIASPKLATEVAALIAELAHGRAIKPSAGRAEPAPVAWIGTTDDIAELEAAIAADPDAQGPYTVLGDYWTANGDARGELVAIGAALTKNPTHKVMRAAWTKHYAEHKRALWGELAGMIDRIIYDVDWYMGFVRACRVPRYSNPGSAVVVHALLDDPGPGRFIQRLAVENDGSDVARVLAQRPRPTLRTLELGGAAHDVSPIWRQLAYLRELRITGSNITLGEIRAPHLERFAIELGTIDEGELQDVGFLAPLWRGEGLPNLRTLALTNCEHTDALCAALVASPLAAQLVEIDLREGTMTDAGAALLLAHRFPKLERATFDLNYLTVDVCAQLATLAAVVSTDAQRVDDGNRHSAGFE